MSWYTKTRRAQNDQDYEAWQEGGVCPTLNAFDNHTETRATVVIDEPTVRRLTPLECERLQGFPDNWTALRSDGSEQADSHRYKQMGNAVAVPVVEWVIQGIVELER